MSEPELQWTLLQQRALYLSQQEIMLEHGMAIC